MPVTVDTLAQIMPGAEDMMFDWGIPSSIAVLEGEIDMLNELLSSIICCRVSSDASEPALQVTVDSSNHPSHHVGTLSHT